MPICICSKCGLRVPDGFHPLDVFCRCVDWLTRYEENGWILHPYTKEILECEHLFKNLPVIELQDFLEKMFKLGYLEKRNFDGIWKYRLTEKTEQIILKDAPLESEVRRKKKR